ncbi:ABC transporter substrate-binding protein [soil metagenome]
MALMNPSLTAHRWLAVAVLALSSSLSFAQSPTEAPDEMVKRISTDVLTTIQGDQKLQSGDTGALQQLIDSKILPYVNFERMTSSAVGRSWPQATPDQRSQLIAGFKRLLIKTYSGAMTSAGDAKLQFRPLRAAADANEVVVRSQVMQSAGDPIQLDYRVAKEPAGWKIYDVNVVGVWLVENYRTQFQQQISSGGIDSLITTLNNRK